MNQNLFFLDISPFRLSLLWSSSSPRPWETAAIVVGTGVLGAAALWLCWGRIGNPGSSCQLEPLGLQEEDSIQGHSSSPDEHKE